MKVIFYAGADEKQTSMRKKYIRYVKVKSKNLTETWAHFTPRHFVKEEKAAKEARQYALEMGGITVVFRTKEGKYTFSPFHGDTMSNVHRMARALGAEVCEDFHRWDI